MFVRPFIGGGVPPYITTGMRIGAGNSWYRTGLMANATALTIVMAAKLTTPVTANQTIVHNRTSPASDSPQYDYAAGGSAGENVVRLTELHNSGGAVITTNTWTGNIPDAQVLAWHAVGMCANAATGTFQLWFNGVSRAIGGAAITVGDIRLTGSAGLCRFGDFFGSLAWDVSHIWIASQAVDFNTKWSSFFDASNKPIYLGATGELPTGVTPQHFAPDGNLAVNLGTEANWTVTGTPTVSPTSPTD